MQRKARSAAFVVLQLYCHAVWAVSQAELRQLRSQRTHKMPLAKQCIHLRHFCAHHLHVQIDLEDVGLPHDDPLSLRVRELGAIFNEQILLCQPLQLVQKCVCPVGPKDAVNDGESVGSQARGNLVINNVEESVVVCDKVGLRIRSTVLKIPHRCRSLRDFFAERSLSAMFALFLPLPVHLFPALSAPGSTPGELWSAGDVQSAGLTSWCPDDQSRKVQKTKTTKNKKEVSFVRVGRKTKTVSDEQPPPRQLTD